MKHLKITHAKWFSSEMTGYLRNDLSEFAYLQSDRYQTYPMLTEGCTQCSLKK